MRLRRLDHVAIAVTSLDEALASYAETLGLKAVHRERVADQKVEVALLPVGDSFFELIMPEKGNVGVARFLATRGPGLHHVCIEVDDLESALSQLREAGVALIDECPRIGARGDRIAFVHPKGLGGVLVEMLQASGRP